MIEQIYPGQYYSDRHEQTFAAAKLILEIVQSIVPGPIRSAADVGCGVGTWLAVLVEQGCEDIVGYDGDWVPPEYLRIPAARLVRCNLSKTVEPDRRFDLAISLECAEHLPSESASVFVEFLCKLSDFVVFGAAIPNQTGEGHINEQWPEYWAQLFSKRGYTCLDWIRPKVWTNKSIPWWYRQNTMLFVRSERRNEMKAPRQENDRPPLPLVHPLLLDRWIGQKAAASPAELASIKQAVRQLRRAIVARIKRG